MKMYDQDFCFSLGFNWRARSIGVKIIWILPWSFKVLSIWKNWWRARNFPDEIFPLSIILYFCDHGIKSGLRPMLNCIFHTAISCWYAVSCIPKWTPYFLKNDSVTRIWFLIGLNLFRSISYSSLFNLIWLCLTPNNPIMTNLTSLFKCPGNIFVELSEFFI